MSVQEEAVSLLQHRSTAELLQPGSGHRHAADPDSSVAGIRRSVQNTITIAQPKRRFHERDLLESARPRWQPDGYNSPRLLRELTSGHRRGRERAECELAVRSRVSWGIWTNEPSVRSEGRGSIHRMELAGFTCQHCSEHQGMAHPGRPATDSAGHLAPVHPTAPLARRRRGRLPGGPAHHPGSAAGRSVPNPAGACQQISQMSNCPAPETLSLSVTERSPA